MESQLAIVEETLPARAHAREFARSPAKPAPAILSQDEKTLVVFLIVLAVVTALALAYL